MSSTASPPMIAPSSYVGPVLFAHRGYSSRQPEMTVAAYREAIGWSARTGVPVGLECDVHLSADRHPICLHDFDVDRTSDGHGPAAQLSVAELKRLDFGARRTRDPDPAAHMMITLAELLDMVADARRWGVEISLAIETKHPDPAGPELERQVQRLLVERGWDGPGSPCRVISFSRDAVERVGRLLPAIERTLLVEHRPGMLAQGRLPVGVDVAGIQLALLRRRPELVSRLRAAGHQAHVWTVNRAEDVELCLDLGVTGLTTDDPDLVLEAVRRHTYAPAF